MRREFFRLKVAYEHVAEQFAGATSLYEKQILVDEAQRLLNEAERLLERRQREVAAIEKKLVSFDCRVAGF